MFLMSAWFPMRQLRISSNKNNTHTNIKEEMHHVHLLFLCTPCKIKRDFYFELSLICTIFA